MCHVSFTTDLGENSRPEVDAEHRRVERENVPQTNAHKKTRQVRSPHKFFALLVRSTSAETFAASTLYYYTISAERTTLRVGLW